MSYSQKYTLVHFILPKEAGAEFHMSEWPLHITLADVFAINRRESKLDVHLQTLLSKTSPITTTVVDDGMLSTTPVMLLEKVIDLQHFHESLVAMLEEGGAAFNTPEFTRNGFIPHSTKQANSNMVLGNTVTIDSVSLIDMYPDAQWQKRRVLATYRMKQHTS